MAHHREMQREVHGLAEIPMALRWARHMMEKGLACGGVLLTAGRPRRTLSQNDKLWPMLTDVSRQVEWYGKYLRKEDWKEVFTASLRQQRAVPGIEGGFVVLGTSTSRMDKRTFSDLIELIYAFGAEHGVVWSEKAEAAYQKNRRRAA